MILFTSPNFQLHIAIFTSSSGNKIPVMSFPNPNARCHCGGALTLFTSDTPYHRNLKFRKCQFHRQGSNHHLEWADGHICSAACQPRRRASMSTSRASTNHSSSSETPLPDENSHPDQTTGCGQGSELLILINQFRLENSQLHAQLLQRDSTIAKLELSNAKLRAKSVQLQELKTASDTKLRALIAIAAIWITIMYIF